MKKSLTLLAFLTLGASTLRAETEAPQAKALLEIKATKDGKTTTKLYKVDQAQGMEKLTTVAEKEALIARVAKPENEVKTLAPLTKLDQEEPTDACWFGGGYSSYNYGNYNMYYGGYYNFRPVYYYPTWGYQTYNNIGYGNYGGYGSYGYNNYGYNLNISLYSAYNYGGYGYGGYGGYGYGHHRHW